MSSRSSSPKSPSHSPPPENIEESEKPSHEAGEKRKPSPIRAPESEKPSYEVKEKRKPSPIRAPSRSPSPLPVRCSRVSRSPTPDPEGRDEVMSEQEEQASSPRRDRSRSPRRSERRRDGSRERRRDRRDRDRRDDRRRRERSDSRERRDRRSSVSPKRSRREETPKKEEPVKEVAPPKEKKEPVDLLRTRTGGAYIPPAKLKMMQEQIQDKSGEQYQRMNWERLKKRIHGLVNKINTANLVSVVRELLQENVIRGKGLIARSIIQAQAFSPVFSNVYAALVAVINSKFPHVGELILRRLVVQFKRSFRRNDKATTVTVSKFIAHLINQLVAHEVLGLEIMMLMLETPTDDSVEVAIAFLKECGAKLQEIAPRAIDAVFTRLRSILYTSKDAGTDMDIRITYMIEAMMAIRRDKFQAYPAVIEELDLIDEDDQVSHTLALEDAIDPENQLNVFKFDPDFAKNEEVYNEIRAEIIGDAEDSDDEDEEEGGETEEGQEGADESGGAGGDGATTEIIDKTEQNLVAFRREVYLTIQSSLDYQEAAHKLLKMRVKKELEPELCHMLVDCCTQERTYSRFFGLLCERFCRLKKEFQMTFEQVARDTYATVHRFEITKLRNISRLLSHLLFTDAISWMVLSDIHLTEEDTTSSGRIFIKYIFQELCESMGLAKLYERIKDPTLQTAFAGLFPRDNPQNARFAVNFFTLIGLGGLTIDLREWLEKGQKKRKEVAELDSDVSSDTSSDESSSSSEDSSDSDEDSSSSSSSDSDSEDDKKKRKKKEMEKKKKNKKTEEKENKHRHRSRGSREAAVQVKVEVRSPSPRRERKRDERSRGDERDERNRDDRRDERSRGDERDERRERRRHDSEEKSPVRERRRTRSPRQKKSRKAASRSPSVDRREKRVSRSPKRKEERKRSPKRSENRHRDVDRRERVSHRRRSRS